MVGEDRVDALGDLGRATQGTLQYAAVHAPSDGRHATRAPLEPLGVLELGSVVGKPGEVGRNDVREELSVLRVPRGDLVTEREQQLGGRLHRPARRRTGLHAGQRALERRGHTEPPGVAPRRLSEAHLRLGWRVGVA